MAIKILSMQIGFALLEGGYTRRMHMANIMMKNLVDLVLSGIGFFLFGYRLAYKSDDDLDGDKDSWNIYDFTGVPANPWSGIAGAAIDPAWFFFQWSFAATASTIDSGALAERVNFLAYLVLSFWESAFIYTIVCHWTWGGGWLAQEGFVDFAGGMVVHGLGGISALVGASFLGPRIGRFPEFRQNRKFHWFVKRCCRRRYNDTYFHRPTGSHERSFWVDLNPSGATLNPTQNLFGTLMLWIGWYGFNPGSTGMANSNQDSRAALVALNTTISGCCGGMVGLIWSVCRYGGKPVFTVEDLCNGVLCGLVAITGGCCCVDVTGATCIGIFIPILGLAAAKVVDKCQVDDVVSATSVHGVCGILGTLSIGFFANPDCLTGEAGFTPGLFYGGSAELLRAQIIGCLAIGLWAAFHTWFTCFILDVLIGFRADRFEELVGLDYCEHNFVEDQTQRGRLQKQLEALRAKLDEDSESFTSFDEQEKQEIAKMEADAADEEREKAQAEATKLSTTARKKKQKADNDGESSRALQDAPVQDAEPSADKPAVET